MNRCRHYLISGRVQGVFYRGSAHTTARRLGLRGWVRNLPDGRVEAVACGDDAQLNEFERWLWRGPAQARVAHVEVEETTVEGFADFEVKG